MKKLLAILLFLAMIVSLVSCDTNKIEDTSASSTNSSSSETTDTSFSDGDLETVQYFVSPADEKRTTKTIVKENDDGIKMEITFYGYASESLGKDFYMKHDEYIRAEVKITNGSEDPYYQTVPTCCVKGQNPHRHEFDVDIADANGHRLTINSAYEACPEMLYTWEIKVGETYAFRLNYVAGEALSDFRTGKTKVEDFTLYDGSIYTDGVCEFSGDISFGYFEPIDIIGQMNDREISADVAFEVVYVKRSETSAFVHPDDSEYIFKEFIKQNEDLELKVIFGVSESESLGEDAYFQRDEILYGNVYITNTSNHSIYFTLHAPIELVGLSEPYEFDIKLMSANGYTLDHLKGYTDVNMYISLIELKPGEMFMRSMRFAPGEYVKGYYVDENGNDCYTDGGFRYYGEDAYKDGKMRFEGTVSLGIYYDSHEAYLHSETKSISVDVALTCLYTPIESTID